MFVCFQNLGNFKLIFFNLKRFHFQESLPSKNTTRMSVLDKQNDSRILVFNLAAEQCTVRSGRCDGVKTILLKLNLLHPNSSIRISIHFILVLARRIRFPNRVF